MAHHQLDELDEKILKLIIGNARMSFFKIKNYYLITSRLSSIIIKYQYNYVALSPLIQFLLRRLLVMNR